MTTAILTKFLGAGASAGEGASLDQIEAVNVAKECLLAALKVDPKAAHIWATLANAYYLTGDHRSSSKCLEKVLMVHCYSHLLLLLLRLFIGFLDLLMGKSFFAFLAMNNRKFPFTFYILHGNMHSTFCCSIFGMEPWILLSDLCDQADLVFF